jgi:hypothetical protein
MVALIAVPLVALLAGVWFVASQHSPTALTSTSSGSSEPSRSPSGTVGPRSEWVESWITSADAAVEGVDEFSGRLYAWGSADGNAALWVSTAGQSWSPLVTTPNGHIWDIVEFRGRLYAWGSAGRDATVWVSADGTTWSQTTLSFGGLRAMKVLDGQLVAWGGASTDRRYAQPAIWTSRDGDNWIAADFPLLHMKHLQIEGIVHTNDRLVALATNGLTHLDDISDRPTGTLIFESFDGSKWKRVNATPPADSGPHGILIEKGGTLRAVGSDVWTSTDGGRTWEVTTTNDELGGRIMSATEHDGVIVAWGRNDLRRKDLHGCPNGKCDFPYFTWSSPDGGQTWAQFRRVVGDELLFGDTGRIVLTGASASDIWMSDDRGQTWQKRRPPEPIDGWGGAATVPGGFVIAAETDNDLDSHHRHFIFTSADGATWNSQPVAFWAQELRWTPTYGLVAHGPCDDGLRVGACAEFNLNPIAEGGQ